MTAYFDVTDVADVPMYSDRQLRDACAKARAEGAAAERDRILREAAARKATLVRPALGRDQFQEVDYIRLSVLADLLREPS